MEKTKIGIVGLGFVGGAVKNAYESIKAEIVCIDPYKGYNSTYEDLTDCEAVFVCVPSPVGDDGKCDTSFLEEVIGKLKNYKGVIISKVTAPPDIYIKLQKENKNLVHFPEFLTAVNANNDYLMGEFCIAGGESPAREKALGVVTKAQKYISQIKFVGIGEASLAKYSINCFLAIKVIYFNELYDLCKSADLNFEVVRSCIGLDKRVGLGHTRVPGIDGKFGFGGACFPKDSLALLKYAEEKGANLSVLFQAGFKNNNKYKSE